MTYANYRVNERIFMLDCGRKYFTPAWIKRLIDEIRAAGFNAINMHFAEDMAIRLESKKFPWLAGGDHTLCGFGAKYGRPEDDGKYLTQDEMRDIVSYAFDHGVNVIPSLDSPGHMTYTVMRYKQNVGRDIGMYFHKHGKVAIVQAAGERAETSLAQYSSSIDIINPEALTFVKELYTEYGTFFRELGCTSFDIGGDEILGWGDAGSIDKTVPKWSNLDHWEAYAKKVTGNENAVAYDAFLLYFNDIAALLRSLGYTSIRMWNDDVCRHDGTGWQEVVQLDTSIALQFWSSHTNNDRNTAKFYLDRGYGLYNFCRAYNYYTMYPAGSSFSSSYVTPEAIMKEWTPYVFTPKDSICDTKDNEYIFPKFNPENHIEAPDARIKGAGFCLWTDTPSVATEDELLEIIRPYFTALGRKASGMA